MINYSANSYLCLLIATVVLCGCASSRATQLPSREIPSVLAVKLHSPDKVSPQAATMTTILWSASASGGEAPYTFAFHTLKGTEESVEQQDSSNIWGWRPLHAGTYRVKAVVRDALGNIADSGWMPGYEIFPALRLKTMKPDKAPPQAASSSKIRWTASAEGGVGPFTYEFHTMAGDKQTMVQKGPSPAWDWIPMDAGTYRLKVIVRDALGNTVDSGWLSEFEVAPKVEIVSLKPDRNSPQAAVSSQIRWSAVASGGIGALTYEFRILNAVEETLEQRGPLHEWRWLPKKAGSYRVMVVVRDSAGNMADSGWSTPFEVVPPLFIESLRSDNMSPAVASNPFRWVAAASGGIGTLEYEFHITRNGKEVFRKKGPSPALDWIPSVAGTCRIKVIIRDSHGNTADSGWSREYTFIPPLSVSSLGSDKASPQVANAAKIRWISVVDGGMGARTYAFYLHKDNEVVLMQKGESPTWIWVPQDAGIYRVKVSVKDLHGNVADSSWSPEYEVAPPLLLKSFNPDKPSPQTAVTTTINWKADVSGGAGSRLYEFRSFDGTEEVSEQKGSSPVLAWTPMKEGLHRVKVIATDALGNRLDGGWSPEYMVMPQLKVDLLAPDRQPPQAAGTTTIRWTAKTSGGVGEKRYEFRVSDGKEERILQEGPSSSLEWAPREPGSYRVNVIVRDALGNIASSGWSPPYAVVLPPAVINLVPDVSFPQRAVSAVIRWTAVASGGIGAYVYEFHVSRRNKEIIVQKGPSPVLEWRPEQPGFYRVKVVLRDALGNTADSGWSSGFEITRELGLDSLIAVFPIENLSGVAAPVKEINQSVITRMKRNGIKVVDEVILEKFMTRHRIRYAAGLSKDTGQALRQETGAAAVLAISIDLFSEDYPPRVALTSRLISTGRKASIIWMDSIVVAGNDAPGILGIGLERDSRILRDRVVNKILDSMSGHLLSGETGGIKKNTGRSSGVGRSERFHPKEFFRNKDFALGTGKTLSVAVLPFFNDSSRKNAGEIMRLHFLKHLAERGDLVVIDPGEVRMAILRSRMILEGGLSLPQAALLREEMDADLVFYGSVRDYQDSIGPAGFPLVNFSSQAIDTNKKKVAWSSTSYNTGSDCMFLFDWGKVSTSHALAAEMTDKVIERALGSADSD
ncbi:MAG: hypothetical protein ACM31N_03000 [Deltaproteobacteria bacterium]